MEQRLYRPREVAEALSISRGQVYALAERGLIRVVRIGTSVRIPASEIERLSTTGIIPQRAVE